MLNLSQIPAPIPRKGIKVEIKGIPSDLTEMRKYLYACRKTDHVATTHGT